MSKLKLDLVIVGVGGQGTLLASKILGRLALDAGLNVKVSEVHGMAQRGGSVITHVRMGETLYAPLVSKGGADYVLAFEELEGARNAGFLKKDGVLIVNAQQLLPMPVITGAAKYPDNPLCGIANAVKKADALALAQAAGSDRSVNLVLLGILAQDLPFSQEQWLSAIGTCVPPKTLEINVKAFGLGLAEEV